MERMVTIKNVQISESELRSALKTIDNPKLVEFHTDQRIRVFSDVGELLLVRVDAGACLISDYNYNRWSSSYIEFGVPITIKELENTFRIRIKQVVSTCDGAKKVLWENT